MTCKGGFMTRTGPPPRLIGLDRNTASWFTSLMKVTIEVPEKLYRQVKAKSALEGRAVREVAEELFRDFVHGRRPDEVAEPAGAAAPSLITDEPVPEWFGALRSYARKAGRHDMESIRESIARGVAEDRRL